MDDTLTNYILNHDTAEQTLLASSYATDQEAIHICNVDTSFPVLITSLGVNDSTPDCKNEPVQAIISSTLKLQNDENTKDNHDNKHTIETNQHPGIGVEHEVKPPAPPVGKPTAHPVS